MTGEADPKEGRKATNPLRGLIRKPQVLGAKESRDSVRALLSHVDIDPALPPSLTARARALKEGVEAANGVFKLDILQDLADEASAGDVRKRFAALAIKTASKQVMDYRRLLEEREREHRELNEAVVRAWEALQEEQAPMLRFLAKHAPDDPEVERAREALGRFTTGMEEAKAEVEGAGALIAASKAKETALEKMLEGASKGLK
ncbi:MAG: hypothetical protein JRN46_01680 [Nitrososphaerota archaeon]|nr:hypothetical protein [Nitrososphaerota archaeon]